MLFLAIALLMPAVALPSIRLSSSLAVRTASLVLLSSCALALNVPWSSLGSGASLYSGALYLTPTNLTLVALIFVVGALALLPWSPAAASTTGQVRAEYGLLALFSVAGSSLLLFSSSLLGLYLGLELQSFGAYILAGVFSHSVASTGAALQYLLLGGLSSAILLLGVAVLYAATGTVQINELASMISLGSEGGLSELHYGFVLIGVGLLFKASAAPFHQWAPDVYQGVPTGVATWLAVLPKISVLGVLMTLSSYLGTYSSSWGLLLTGSCLLSLILGSVVGLAQPLLKRLLAYSTVAQLGWLLLALLSSTGDGTIAYLFYLSQYTLSAVLAFLVLVSLGNVMGIEVNEISSISGLALNGRSGFLGLSLALTMLSMAGVPPLAGFFAKQLALLAALGDGLLLLSIVGVVTSVVAAGYYLRLVRTLYFASQVDTTITSTRPENVQASLPLVSYSVSLLTLGLLLFAVNPPFVLDSLHLLALTFGGSWH